MQRRVAHDAAFPHLPLADFELRLDEGDERGARCRQRQDGGKNFFERDEAGVAGDEIGGLRHLFAAELAGVYAFEHDDARIVAEFPGELAAPHVHGIDLGGAALEQHVGEAARRGADVEADHALGIDGETIEAVGELQAAARRVRMRLALDLERRVVGNGRARLLQAPRSGKDAAGHDEGLGLGARLRQAALDEELIEAGLRRGFFRSGWILLAAFDHEAGDVAQQVGLFLEQFKMGDRLFGEHQGLGPRPLDAEDGNEGRLAGVGVLADFLAEVALGSQRIQEIVGDLERQAEIVGEGFERVARRVAGLAEDGARLAGEGDELARLQSLEARDGADVDRLILRLQIHHLAADHALGAGGGGHGGDEPAAHLRVGVGRGIAEDSEGERQQCIAGQNRRRLAEFDVAGGLAAPQIVVVHRRQIVVDQRIGVDHLDRGGGAQRAFLRNVEQLRGGHDEERAEPFSARHDGVMHPLEDPAFEPVALGEQPLHFLGDGGGRFRQRLLQSAQASLNRCRRVRCRPPRPARGQSFRPSPAPRAASLRSGS